MIATHEPFIANGASKTLFAGVSAQVALQLVRSSEPFAAEEPIADERALTCRQQQREQEEQRKRNDQRLRIINVNFVFLFVSERRGGGGLEWGRCCRSYSLGVDGFFMGGR